MQIDSDEIRKYLGDRKREAVTIDPKTAEVTWSYEETLDPYGVHDLPPELRQSWPRVFCSPSGQRDLGLVWRFAVCC